MKIKLGDLRKLIRENYALEIPQYVIVDICSDAAKMNPKNAAMYCKDKLEHFFKMHINSPKTKSAAELRLKIVKMHNVLANMEQEIRDLKVLNKEELKEIVDRHVYSFLHV